MLCPVCDKPDLVRVDERPEGLIYLGFTCAHQETVPALRYGPYRLATSPSGLAGRT